MEAVNVNKSANGVWRRIDDPAKDDNIQSHGGEPSCL